MNVLSQHILAVGNRNNLNVTNLQLQKVMYFVIQDYLRDHNGIEFIKKIYNRPFESWQYGPVEPDIYYRYSQYGSMPIINKGHYHKAYWVLDESIVHRLTTDVFDLIDESHAEKFWQKNFCEHHQRAKYRLIDIVND